MYKTIRKSFVLGVGALLFMGYAGFAQSGVTIGSNNPPNSSAVLDLQSTTGGFLPPRVTATQRNAILNPAIGLTVYNTTVECLEVYHSTGWKQFSCSCSNPPPAPGAITGSVSVCEYQSAVQYFIHPVPGASSYSWTVPNGASIQSGQGDTLITVNYTQGSGSITVQASNFCGNSGAAILAVTAANPNSSFTANPPQFTTGQPGTFMAASPGLQYSWTFTNGVPATSNLQNPSVTYAVPGTYQVRLIVTGLNGCVDTTIQNITVSNCPAPGQQQAVFNYTGGQQTFTVPNTCVNQVVIECWGAQGGTSTAPGGLGGYAKGTLNVSPGQVLNIFVGGQGVAVTGGYNGGGSGYNNGSYPASGGGGGGTDVRVNGTNFTDRVIVAGGGGGSCTLYSGNFSTTTPGAGGDVNGTAAGTVNNGSANAIGGGGGTQSTGGAAGSGTYSGTAGVLGQGGNGYTGSNSSGGGGGGGYYGGGGGGHQTSGTDISSSGGGGSGYVGGVTNTTMQTGIRSGHGQVIITY